MGRITEWWRDQALIVKALTGIPALCFLCTCFGLILPTPDPTPAPIVSIAEEPELPTPTIFVTQPPATYTPLATLIPTSPPLATATPIPLLQVVVASANIRSGPSTNFPALGSTPNKSIFPVLGEALGWYNIELETNERGWIAGSVVELLNGVTDVTQASTIPAEPVQNAPQQTNTPRPITTRAEGATGSTTSGSTSSSPACSCIGDIENCDSFANRTEIEACFNYCQSVGAGDVHDLDRDDDGIACEENP